MIFFSTKPIDLTDPLINVYYDLFTLRRDHISLQMRHIFELVRFEHISSNEVIINWLYTHVYLIVYMLIIYELEFS